MKIIYIIDPYYADSHRFWAESLKRNLPFEILVFSLPAVHWKWRMEGAAIALAEKINTLKKTPDIFLVTDYLNLALFKSLLRRNFSDVPFLLYMHENQLTYPISSRDTDHLHSRDNHYGFINYTSALIADKVIFNSEFHKNDFLEGLKKLSNKLPDKLIIEPIVQKSFVIPLTLGSDWNLTLNKEKVNDVQRIVWNHRWEYDKRPDIFLDAMINIQQKGIPFQLILLGKMDASVLKRFEARLKKLAPNILHLGYCMDKKEYQSLLCSADIIVSTAEHEFFGVSVLEGICSGCKPLLPNDLAYPELIPINLHNEILYEKGTFEQALKLALTTPWTREKRKLLQDYIQLSFFWEKVGPIYDEVFASVMNSK